MKSLLPPNETGLRFLEILGKETLAFCDLKNINTLPAFAKKELLTEIAKNLDMPIDDLKEQEAREILNKAFLIHKNAGTPEVLKTALEVFFENIEIKEWFSYGGEPYYFKVKANPKEGGNLKLLEKLVKHYKNVRSKLESVELEVLLVNSSFDSLLSLSGEIIEIYPKEEV